MISISETAYQAKEHDGATLFAGEKLVFDLDSDRRIGIDLSQMYMHGTVDGDSLSVTYLEETEDGGN